MRVALRTVLVIALLFAQVLFVDTDPAYAAQCGSACQGDPDPPARPAATCGEYCAPGIRPTVSIYGFVTTARGTPVVGAAVYWEYGIVTTDSSGSYSVSVWGDAPVTLVADASLLAWKSLHLSNPILASALPQNFELKFLLTTSVDPQAFNNSAPKTLTFSAYSTAPLDGTRVVVQLASGAVLNLEYDGTYTDPEGWRRWSVAWTVPEGTADDVYLYRACALDSVAQGSCSVPLGLVLSQVRAQVYYVDSVAPNFLTPSPTPNKNWLIDRPTIAAGIEDLLSGIDAASLRVHLDATLVSASYSSSTGLFTYTPETPLGLGIHTVAVLIADRAGNEATASWSFNVASATFEPSSASITRAAPVQFPPGASQVTFSAVPLDISRSDVQLSSAMSTGLGNAARSVSLNSVVVTFRQAALETSTAHNLGSSGVSDEYGILAPSEAPIAIPLPSRVTQLGPISVEIPPAFRLTGGEARLSLGTTPVQAALEYPDAAPALPDCSPGSCEVIGVVECKLDSASPITACDGTSPEVYLHVAGQRRAVVGGQASVLHQNSTTWPKGPPSRDLASGVTAMDLAGGVQQHKTFWVLGTENQVPLFRAYGNHYYYSLTSAQNEPRLAVWQASDVHPGSSPCVTGAGPRLRAKLKEFGNTVEALRGWTLSSNRGAMTGSSGTAFDPPTQMVVLPPSETPGSTPSLYVMWQTADIGGALTPSNRLLQGDFVSSSGETYASNGEKVSAPNGAVNAWVPESTPEAGQAWIEAMTGSEFTGPNATDYAARVAIFFRFGYENEQC